MRVLLLGTRKLGYDALLQLVNHPRHKVVGLVTEDYAITDGYSSEEFRALAVEHDIPFFKTEAINNDGFAHRVRDMNVDIGVSFYWKRLIRSPLVHVPRFGFINAHCSDLPRYRGFAVPSWQILLGEHEAFVTLHEVVDGVADNGRICASGSVPIDESSTIGDIQRRLFQMAVDLLIPVLDGYEDKTLQPRAQDESRALLAYPRLPQDGQIDWRRPAIEIDRLVRALGPPYPGAFTFLHNDSGPPQRLFVWRARILRDVLPFVGVPGHVVKNDANTGTSWVVTGDGLLGLESVQLEAGEPFAPGTSWRSVRMRLGLNVANEIEQLWERILNLELSLKESPSSG
jgi:methionyl-tRNA formyltransferase